MTCIFHSTTSLSHQLCQSTFHVHRCHFLTGNAPSDTNERAHFWLGPDSNLTTTHELLDSPLSERMYIDQNEVVRVRVEADEFYDDEPGPPNQQATTQVEKRAPYTIIVSW